MSTNEITKPINPDEVKTAIEKLATHQFRTRLSKVSGNESHRILPEIWPVIQEVCLIADACEAGIIEVKR